MRARNLNRERQSLRFRSVHQCLEFARIAASIGGWFSAAEIHRRFQEDVGPVHRRTVRRYMAAIELAGLVESGMQPPREISSPGGPARFLHYRWLGWPAEATRRGKS